MYQDDLRRRGIGRIGISYFIFGCAVLAMAFCAPEPGLRIGFVAATAVASGVYLVLGWKGRVTMREVLVLAVLLRIIMVPIGPSLSDDTYRYIWDGMLQHEGINPYAFKPQDLTAYHQLPIYDLLNSKRFYTVYPPVSQLVFGFSGFFHHLGWIYSYYVIKALIVLFEIAGIFLLSRMVSAQATWWYALNPLALIEVAGQGHTEGMMVFFLFLTLWGARQEKGKLAVVALTMAVWIKLYPLVLFPFLLRRVGWRNVWVAGAASLIVGLPYYHPDALGHVSQSLDLYVRAFEFNAGIYYSLKWAARTITGQLGWGKTIGPVFRLLFLLSLPVVYVLDWRRGWSLAKTVFITLGLYLVFATTIHPWYFLGMVAMYPFLKKPAWAWQWLSLMLIASYLYYTHGISDSVIAIAWIGWIILGWVAWQKREIGLFQTTLEFIQQWRAERKVAAIAPFFPPDLSSKRVLDLGAGEGYVGAEIQKQFGSDVILADVLPLNKTTLPHVHYDGRHLPFEDQAFNVTILYFVLHHCEDAEQVVREAMRVTKDGLIVVESVYEGKWDFRLLTFLDRLANRLRSGGLMKPQEEFLHFRTVPVWSNLFEQAGCTILETKQHGRIFHKQAFFSLKFSD